MNITPFTNAQPRHTKVSILGILTIGLGLFMASPVTIPAQELFMLSTESGLEMYQVEILREPNLLINSYRSTNTPKEAGDEGMKNDLMVHAGLQITPHGRLLTKTGNMDFDHNSKLDSLLEETVTLDRKPASHLKDPLALRIPDSGFSSSRE